MPQIIVLPHLELCPEGTVLEVESGTTVCDALLANHIEIEHACEKSCACTTCHVIVRRGFDDLKSAEEDEEDLLDRAWGLEPTSRLSCQTQIPIQSDLVIEIPRYSINHAKENH
ncbi:ISC system 2Fe-2S type ferredoxin [Candidatus Pandoraea novymonadis]|uniref:2Fe-2S ferredoxin n=1 Tax=Candidatus Pandoraea novymonadis TaxID=1808959 RepID=A0ABX5FEG2_9BURK|nr:ISC system 2Fe-2S type ferredoxin [Candidatus Pandoraea novymonadis]PSB92070.1 2Fe-2S ferredoxin [Candidatus Pandoraea novymonadis]